MKRIINKIFGYGYIIVGGIGIIAIIFMIISIVKAFGGESYNIDWIYSIAPISDYGQLPIVFGSIIMIFVNKDSNFGIKKGYILGIVGYLIYLFLGWIFGIFMFAIKYGLFVYAGLLIITNNPEEEYKNEFLIPKKGDIESVSTNDYVEAAQTDKVKEEIIEWKKLLDSGEIDKESYEYEAKKILEKEQKKLRNNNSRLI